MRKSKYSSQVDEIIDIYGPCVLQRELYTMVRDYMMSKEGSYDHLGNTERGIYNRLVRVFENSFEGRVEGQLKYNILSILPNPSILDIAYSFNSPKRYLSHNSAFYLAGISNQKPTEVFISQFSSGRTSKHTGEYDPKLAKMLFSKPSRSKTLDVKFDVGMVRIINKNDRGIGFIKKVKPYQDTKFEINVENLEMNLIDSVLNPDYSGGVYRVLETFEKVEINLSDLFDCYKKNDFFYPYWQTIGFYLSKSGKNNSAKEWRNLFNQDLKEFYLEHGFRSDWILDPEWKIWSPRF